MATATFQFSHPATARQKIRRTLARILRLTPRFEVENLRGYSAEIISHLRSVLRAPASSVSVTIHSDPNRIGFFDIETPSRTFYIHVAPAGYRIHLLGVWPARAQKSETSDLT